MALTTISPMVAQIAFDHVETFPKSGKHSNPTVQTQNPAIKKIATIFVGGYLQRFRNEWAWFYLAKAVAQFSNYGIQESSMTQFNVPNYQVCKSEI